MTKKVALVTGANKGIGYETARTLAREGVHVLLGSRDRVRGEKAASELAKEHQSHADLVLLRYTDDQGNWLQVGQGFPGFSVAMVSGAPEAFTGTVQVDGVEATWIDGWPGGEGWQPGIRTALYWDAGRMGSGWEVSPQGTVTTGSPLSVGLSSNVLTLDELVGVAESLQ